MTICLRTQFEAKSSEKTCLGTVASENSLVSKGRRVTDSMGPGPTRQLKVNAKPNKSFPNPLTRLMHLNTYIKFE
jgi:hypothetical protein